MARRAFDQYFRAGAAGLVRETDEPASRLNGGLTKRDTRRATARSQRGPLTRRRKFPLALVLVSAGLSALSGLPGWHVLATVGVSVLLGGVACRISGWLLHARGGAGARGLVRELLLLAIAVTLIWLAWVSPGAWQYGLVIAVTAALAIREPRWREHHDAALAHHLRIRPAHRLIRRTGVPGRTQRPRRRGPAAAPATIGLLLLLNILIALALLATARLSLGFWALHTKIAFVVMACVDVLVLNSGSPSPRAAAALSPHNGHQQRARPKPAEPVRATAADELPRMRRIAGRFQPRLAAGAVVAAAVWTGYAHPGLVLILATVVIGSAILSTMETSRHQAVTMVLAMATGVATVDYVSWRLSVTNWQGWWLAVPLLAAEALGAAHILGFQFTVWPWPAPVIEPGHDPARHPVFMFVPTLNEGVATLRPTLQGCIEARRQYLARHPHGQVTIVVCNDGRAAGFPRWAEVDMLSAELGVSCVTRINSGGAKAGNIENARRKCRTTGQALLAIFDADQVPKPDFLLKTVPPFADAKVGWVQTGQYYANLDNPVSRWADDQQSMFYNLLCPGKAALNAAFICGTNVVIRAAALDEIGGLPQDSVTEDFAASIALHPRWRSIYLPDVLAAGLGPLDIPSYLKQQGRWALGTLGVLRSHWRDILLPRQSGLRPGQRVQYLLACTHYLCGLRDLIYLLSPVLFIFTGVPAVRTATLTSYLLHFAPYAALGIAGMWYSARGVTGLRGIIIGFGSTPALIGSLAAVILGRKRSFAVTAKEHQGQRSLRYLGVYVFFALLCIASLVWTTQVTGRQQTSLFISLLWIAYSLLLLGSFLWLVRADIRAHGAAQRGEAAEVTARQPYPAKLPTAGANGLRPVANLGFAALMASPLLLGAPLASLPMFARAAPPFMIASAQTDARYPGVFLPVQSLRSRRPALERDLGIRFSIVGRTQDISDRFDAAWADKLAAQGARPWISLEFGTFGPGHRPPLDANLVAIVNGVDDSGIRRWAAEIRGYGKPVYLTVLVQTDRNWAVSSAVANGGIPQDVPKAWTHIQSVFRAAGADNVAWVWAPADPLHDQQFAPPPSTIGAVLQDFINYPGTRWGDPRKVLSSLTRRYPGKPIIVEASVSGRPENKAGWLAELGQALDNCPQAYAVIYHEGGPSLVPTAAQLKSWSLASDPQSLAAWKRIVTGPHAEGRLP